MFHHKKFIFKPTNDKHQLKQLSDFFKISQTPYPTIFNNSKEIEIANNQLFSDKKYIIIAPGGNWIPKIWLKNRFNQLIKLLREKYYNLNFIIVGSLAEKKIYFNEVVKDIDNKYIIDLMGETLTQTFSYMKKSNLFIGNDSGLMHLAAASKISTIGLFGPTNDKIYAPFGKNGYTLRTKESYKYFTEIVINKELSYMNSIEIKDVMNLIENKKLL